MYNYVSYFYFPGDFPYTTVMASATDEERR